MFKERCLFGLLLIVSSSFAIPSGIFDWNPDFEGSSWCSPGLYSKGCGPEVTVCTDDGNVVELVCPFSLWFDDESQSCLPPSDVFICRAMDSEVVAPATPLPKDFCVGLADGFHPISDCSASVARCINGSASVFECPAGQVYSTKGCANLDSTTGCNTRTNDDQCSSDGLFEVDTCSPLFLSCGNGISRVMTCPWPLVFDAAIQVCNYDHAVSGCPLKENTMCPSDGFYSYGNCTDMFYACTGDQIQPMHCPSHLAFDGKRKICDYPLAVPECQENNGTSGNDSSGDGEQGSGSGSGQLGSGSGELGSGSEELGSGSEELGSGSGEEGSGSAESSGESSGLEIPFSRGFDNFCKNRIDGFYADGCSSTLIGCSNGITNYLFCPANLFYDEKRGFCDYPNSIVDCEEGSGSGSGKGSGDESQVLSE